MNKLSFNFNQSKHAWRQAVKNNRYPGLTTAQKPNMLWQDQGQPATRVWKRTKAIQGVFLLFIQRIEKSQKEEPEW